MKLFFIFAATLMVVVPAVAAIDDAAAKVRYFACAIEVCLLFYSLSLRNILLCSNTSVAYAQKLSEIVPE